jgi:2-hydroxycyclohexanecarboxyl-CoA dehydrogenase
MIDLSGRMAMIPGASGGIGSHVAEVLCECGADVALGYHGNPKRAEELCAKALTLGRQAHAEKVDATQLEDVQRWVNAVLRQHGRIDILANCCGWNGPFQLFKDQDPTSWGSMIALEMMSCIHFSKAVVGHMIERRQGRIITVGSDSGKVGNSGSAVSAAGRGGVNAFSKSLARELGRYNITVNVICPGPTETPVFDALRNQGDTGEKLVASMLSSIPLKRPAHPREIGATVAFLASEWGGYITGQAISVSGGLTMC